jgi:hypothetical protein
MDSACYAKSGNGRSLAMGDLLKTIGSGCVVVWAVLLFGFLAVGLVVAAFETVSEFVRSDLPQTIAQAVWDNFERLVLAGLLWVLVSTYLETKKIAARLETNNQLLRQLLRAYGHKPDA